MMTRRDFENIADAISSGIAEANANGDGPIETGYIVGHLANVLAESNPRFDRERFLERALGGVR